MSKTLLSRFARIKRPGEKLTPVQAIDNDVKPKSKIKLWLGMKLMGIASSIYAQGTVGDDLVYTVFWGIAIVEGDDLQCHTH